MPNRTDILSEIARLRRQKAEAPLRAEQEQLARALDDVDAMGILDDLRERRFSPRLCHGPKPVYGLTPNVWVGAVIWHRPPGYFGYKTLTLLGIWAFTDGGIMLAAGVKHDVYRHAFFDAEAYHKLITRDYTTYYGDDGSPPLDDSRLFRTRYAGEARLDIRAQLQRYLVTFA